MLNTKGSADWMNTRLGHYDIVEELGRGGMGVVYKGYESSLGRYVAIKVLSASMAHDKVFVERFLREARAMATLNDAHIIQIYFIGQDEEQTFFVMEYIDGESLSTCLKREIRLVPGDALKILLHASQGLAAAHAQGVIHRDIKPGNIMITSRGQVKVADFGIALANQDVSAKLTNTGAFVGTPGYLSPEVCLGKMVDQRSDIFALGIVLFEMLSGRMPFQDDSPLKLMLDVVQADTPDIRELNPDVDEEIARILNKTLAKDPADRYQSCEDLNNDLKKHPLVAGKISHLKVRTAIKAQVRIAGKQCRITQGRGVMRHDFGKGPIVAGGGDNGVYFDHAAQAGNGIVAAADTIERHATGISHLA